MPVRVSQGLLVRARLPPRDVVATELPVCGLWLGLRRLKPGHTPADLVWCEFLIPGGHCSYLHRTIAHGELLPLNHE
jgi:hypothetical protein